MWQALEGGEEVGSSQVARAFLLFKLASDPSSRADVTGSLADELGTAIVKALYHQVRLRLCPPLKHDHGQLMTGVCRAPCRVVSHVVSCCVLRVVLCCVHRVHCKRRVKRGKTDEGRR